MRQKRFETISTSVSTTTITVWYQSAEVRWHRCPSSSSSSRSTWAEVVVVHFCKCSPDDTDDDAAEAHFICSITITISITEFQLLLEKRQLTLVFAAAAAAQSISKPGNHEEVKCLHFCVLYWSKDISVSASWSFATMITISCQINRSSKLKIEKWCWWPSLVSNRDRVGNCFTVVQCNCDFILANHSLSTGLIDRPSSQQLNFSSCFSGGKWGGKAIDYGIIGNNINIDAALHNNKLSNLWLGDNEEAVSALMKIWKHWSPKQWHNGTC